MTARATLMGTLDEKYLAPTAIGSMINCSTFIFGPNALRLPDGSVDLVTIRALVERATWRFPSMRQRLVGTPLGLTTPAWVPLADIDIDAHVTVLPGTYPDDPSSAGLLGGATLPPLDLARPLWTIHAADLDSGRLALIVRIHHAMGDGLHLVKLTLAMSSPQPQAEIPPVDAAEREALGTSPANGWHIMRLAGSAWWAKHGPGRSAWREYWRKPFHRRLRRWGRRLLTPHGRSAPVPPAESRSAYFDVPLDQLRSRGKAWGGSPNDAVVASALHAVAHVRPTADQISMLVPYSMRRDNEARNHVSVIEARMRPGESVEQTVTDVGRRLHEAARGRPAPLLGDTLGYATYIAWARRQMYFGPAPIETILGWPTLDPEAQIGFLATSYAGTVQFCVTTRTDIELDRVRDFVYKSLTSPTGTADPHPSEGVAP